MTPVTLESSELMFEHSTTHYQEWNFETAQLAKRMIKLVLSVFKYEAASLRATLLAESCESNICTEKLSEQLHTLNIWS